MSSRLKQICGFDTSISVFDFRFFKLGSISGFLANGKYYSGCGEEKTITCPPQSSLTAMVEI
ncbi:hypothetical protein ABKV19_012300 [Rosa sericea]